MAATGTTADAPPPVRRSTTSPTTASFRARAVYSAPLVFDGAVHVLTSSDGPFRDGSSRDAVLRLDLTTGRLAEVAALDAPAVSFGSDGMRYYVATHRAIEAREVDGGARVWERPHDPAVPDPWRIYCRYMPIVDETLFAVCLHRGSQTGNPTRGEVIPGSEGATTSTLVVDALDVRTGERAWRWVHGPVPSDAAATLLAPASAASYTEVFGAAVAGPSLVVTGISTTGPSGVRAYAWGVDRAAGETVWTQSAELEEATLAHLLLTLAEPAGSDTFAFLKLDDLRAVNAARGHTIWSAALGHADTDDDFAGAGFAVSEDALYVGSFQTIYRFDAEDGFNRWRAQVENLQQERWASTHLAVDDARVYARATDRAGGSVLYAFDTETGEPVWRHAVAYEGARFADLQHMYGMGEGVAALVGLDGLLRVLGRTPTSPTPIASASTLYPPPGDEVVLDLSGSLPGAAGGVVAYRVEWGDGTTSDWTDTPRLAHAYSDAGDRVVRYQVRTSANTTGSAYLTMHVGGVQPTLLTLAFAPERQELTLFLIGLALTGTGTLAGALRLSRKRRRLARELRGLDRAMAQAQTAGSRETSLIEHERRALGLLLAGALTDAHHAALRARIDEFRRASRLGSVDERLRFLPHGVVVRLQEILADGRVNVWERDYVLQLVRSEPSLTDAQRRQVEDLLEAWHRADAQDDG